MMPAQDLITAEAALWYELAQQWVRPLWDAGDVPAGCPTWLPAMVAAQRPWVHEVDQFQLPVPISGYHGQPVAVLVVGLNPNLAPNQVLPRLSADFADYVTWHQEEFWRHGRTPSDKPGMTVWKETQQTVQVVPHYAAVDRVLRAVDGRLRLGAGSVYADVWPWKGKDGGQVARLLWNDAEARRLAIERVYRLVDGLRPRLVVTLGRVVAQVLALPWEPRSGTPRALPGRTSTSAVVAYHPAAYAWDSAYAQWLSDTLGTTLRAGFRPDEP